MQKQKRTEKLLKLALFVSFLFCYLEWSGGNSGFIFQMEYSILAENSLTESITHPFVFIPLAGQLVLLVLLFTRTSFRKLTIAALLMLCVLVVMFLLVGFLSGNLKIIAFSLPFIALTLYYIFIFGKRDKEHSTPSHHETTG